MAVTSINVGTLANDGTGDDLREAFIKVNNNFTDLDARNPEKTTASNLLADDATTKGLFSTVTDFDLKFKSPELLILNVGVDENNLQVIKIAEIIQKSVPGCDLKFLHDNPDLDREGLIRDRKINRQSDKRTYKVSFKKLNQLMPTFKCKWSVEEGVRNIIAGLNDVAFNTEVFKRRGFYRLQYLEDLYENNRISDDLRWIKTKQIIT